MSKSLEEMKNTEISRVLICLFLLILSLVGCARSLASKTIIKSRPPGAEVYIDNVRKGVTPLPYSDTAIAGSSKPLKLKKEGYRTFESVIRKSEFEMGTLWILGYPEEYEFQLEKLPEKGKE